MEAPLSAKEEIKLNVDNLFIVKDSNKYKLKIKANIENKEKNFFLDLNENDHENNKTNSTKEDYNNYEEIIKQKDMVISQLLEKIKNLEEELKNFRKEKNNEEIKTYKNENQINDDSFKDFNIKLRNPLHKLDIHSNSIYCLNVLKDGRLISGSCDKSMIIYNKTTYQPDIIIKEHNDYISSICILSSGILVSADKTIKFFNIKGNDYEILQTLNNHFNSVNEIIELRNKYLVSC